MTLDLRVVVDTNVFASQLILPRSKPSEAMRVVLRLGKLLTSEQQLRELFDVVLRPKFEPYVSAEVRLQEVRRLATLVEPVQIVRRVRYAAIPKTTSSWKSQPTAAPRMSSQNGGECDSLSA